MRDSSTGHVKYIVNLKYKETAAVQTVHTVISVSILEALVIFFKQANRNSLHKMSLNSAVTA